MTRFLGIDHPLLLFKDIEAGIASFRRLGFNPAPIGYHPWGTSMSFVTLERSAFELMSIYDAALIDGQRLGDFAFGRYINERLSEREGMSLVALYSTDAKADRKAVEDRGISCLGTIEFGRDVRLPDGKTDRTSCTIEILFDPALPRVSHFICQQHRPDLVWRPEAMVHPNGAIGFASITYFAPEPERLLPRFRGLYGDGAVQPRDGGYTAQTGNGTFEVLDEQAATRRFGALPGDIARRGEAAGIAVAVKVRSLDEAAAVLARNGVAAHRRAGALLVAEPAATNVWIEFVET